MKRVISDIAIATIAFLIIDGLWIGVIMAPKYNDTVTKIQGEPITINYLAAIICYIFLIGGLYYFVLGKIQSFDIKEILYHSVPYGLAVYGTYDFTSASILKNFDFGTAFIDLAWGTFLCSLVSVLTVFSRQFIKSDDDQEHLGSRENVR